MCVCVCFLEEERRKKGGGFFSLVDMKFNGMEISIEWIVVLN